MGFQQIELETGESIVFGPITTTKSTSISGGSGTSQGSLSHRSGRTVGVTTRRIIVEDLDTPEKTQIIPNADVQKVAVKRQQRNQQPIITLVNVTTKSGRTVKLDIRGLSSHAEGTLQETFPGAEVVESKGGSGSKVLLIIAAVIGAIIILACIVPLLVPLVLRLFGG